MARTTRTRVPLQTKRDGPSVDPLDVSDPLGGSPLDPAVRVPMERSFGTSFETVRVRVDPALAAARARAVTEGEQVRFAPGQFAPGTLSGRSLLGHELGHVVQQRAGRVRAPQAKGEAVHDAALEAQADRWGEQAARGERIADAPDPVAAARGPRQFKMQVQTESVTVGPWVTRHSTRKKVRGTYAKTVRPVRVSGDVTPTRTSDRGAAPEPIAFKTIGLSTRGSVYDKGHVMALQLGGEDVNKNIVPQWGHFQRTGEWRQAEVMAFKAAQKGKVKWAVEVAYDERRGGFGPIVPSAFRATATGALKGRLIDNAPAKNDLDIVGKTEDRVEDLIALWRALDRRMKVAQLLGKVETKRSYDPKSFLKLVKDGARRKLLKYADPWVERLASKEQVEAWWPTDTGTGEDMELDEDSSGGSTTQTVTQQFPAHFDPVEAKAKQLGIPMEMSDEESDEDWEEESEDENEHSNMEIE